MTDFLSFFCLFKCFFCLLFLFSFVFLPFFASSSSPVLPSLDHVFAWKITVWCKKHQIPKHVGGASQPHEMEA